VALTPSLEENIRAARRLHGRITPTYLLGQKNGKIHKYKGVRDLLQRYVDKAGLADIHPRLPRQSDHRREKAGP
jgi:hypothetical protein